MKNKLSTVKNPLTVIAIFAGTAEISGTAILPFLEIESQQIYVWFLMLFPLILIIFFFLTLNWNHKVLYAPSDFSNEDNFVNIIKKPSIQETISKIENDLKENEDDCAEDNTANENINLKNSKTSISSSNMKQESDNKSPKFNLEKETILFRNITKSRIQVAQIAELLVLNKLEKELKAPIQREMMIKAGSSRIIFDGLVQTDTSLIGIEVKYFRNRNTFNSSMWKDLFSRFKILYLSLNETQRKSFSIILAIVTDENPKEIQEYVNNRKVELDFPVEIKIYSFEELRNEIAH